MTFKTIEKIMAHCDEDADCLLWRGAVNSCGHPKFSHASVRRIVWKLIHGDIDKKSLVTVTCEKSGCLNPDHLKLTTKSEVTRKVCQRLDVKLRKTASSRRTARARMSKITMEIARAIRSSDRTAVNLASELQVSASLISKVRRNKSWVESASFWQGLGR